MAPQRQFNRELYEQELPINRTSGVVLGSRVVALKNAPKHVTFHLMEI
jgi:hypothetical protein